jgi:hypothetical protein
MQASSVHQLDIESGKVVAEWKFQKDGVDIGMRDITNDTKSSQLDASRATFMGLDDNRLVRWDMRDRNGIVQVRKPHQLGKDRFSYVACLTVAVLLPWEQHLLQGRKLVEKRDAMISRMLERLRVLSRLTSFDEGRPQDACRTT